MMPREKITAATCRTCGLCCVAPDDQDAFCNVTPGDVEHLPPRYRLQVIGPSYFAELCMVIDGRRFVGVTDPALATKEIKIRRGPLRGLEATVCVALRGSPGAQVTCDVYDRRPRICHEALVPGDRACRTLRQSCRTLNRHLMRDNEN